MSRRLTRSRTDRMLGGVCGGLGAQFDVDPVLFRLVFVLMVLMGGSGLLLYLIMWIVIPREPAPGAVHGPAPAPADTVPAPESPEGAAARAPKERRGAAAGIVLLVLGILFLGSNLGWFWWWKWRILWPLALVAAGLWLILSRTGKE